MKKYWLVGMVAAFCLAACQDGQNPDNALEKDPMRQESTFEEIKEENSQPGMAENKEMQALETEWFLTPDEQMHDIDTDSAYKSSFRKMVGEEKPVLYLGMPRVIDALPGEYWVTSDAEIATIKDGCLYGWKEGVVKVRHLTEANGEVLEEMEYVVTTFNDGKQVEACVEEIAKKLSEDGYGRYDSVEPELLKARVNTLQDVADCLYFCGFFVSDDAPIVATMNSCWSWTPPGEVILTNCVGGVADVTNLFAYLLEYDFEKSGFLLAQGYSGMVFPWFYEDGCYYVPDILEMMEKLGDDSWNGGIRVYKTDDEEKLKDYVLNYVNKEETLAIIMTFSEGNYRMPAVYTSYQHDSGKIFSEHSVIGFEKGVFDHISVLYSNADLDFEIVGIPQEEIPKGVPGSKKEVYYYNGY